MRILIVIGLLLGATAAHAQAVVLSSCGTANYASAVGQLHALTMNTAGYLCVSSTTLLTNDQQSDQNSPLPVPVVPKAKAK